ncbi:CsgG/HfaB family protein [Rheinheimera muenzenbergensis]|uniref:CsgG/HfaB family protein n=1 Tax=Rheinheimera muenzenbergensis TaxID=1193628 RepID=A0ABU8C5P6_9GAMM
MSQNSHSNKQPGNQLKQCCVAVSALLLTACISTSPQMGNSKGNVVSGGAGGANAAGANSALESCDAALGTLSVFEDTSLPWWQEYRGRYPTLGSTLPVIRLMIQQSNCFVVVERGKAMNAMNRERELMQSGQLRQQSNIGGGQMVAADYTLSPEIQFAAKGTQGAKALGGAFLGSLGALVGGGVSKNEAATTLLLVDNRSGVQVSAAVGNAGNYDFNILGGMFGGGMAGGASGFSNTPEGKVITAAFADSYNQMVKALRNYKAQRVDGGLGKGGKLTVGGAEDATPQATTNYTVTAAPQPVRPVVVTQSQTRVTVSEQDDYNFRVNKYDERALEKYYDHLKNAASWMSGLATAATLDDKTRTSVVMAMNMFSGQLESHRIELESWPMPAKQKAWATLGKRIEQHNSLFERHRQAALKNTDLGSDLTSMLSTIQLVTKASLLGE